MTPGGGGWYELSSDVGPIVVVGPAPAVTMPGIEVNPHSPRDVQKDDSSSITKPDTTGPGRFTSVELASSGRNNTHMGLSQGWLISAQLPGRYCCPAS